MTKLLHGLTAIALLALAPAARAQALGPTPYTSAADSPLIGLPFLGYFHLDTMEDGFLNTPGVTSTMGMTFGPGFSTESVDADDGSIDGSGLISRNSAPFCTSGVYNLTNAVSIEWSP